MIDLNHPDGGYSKPINAYELQELIQRHNNRLLATQEDLLHLIHIVDSLDDKVDAFMKTFK